MLMKNVKRFGAVAIAMVMALAVAAPVSASSEITVGEFIQELARSKNLIASSPRVASDSLAAIGVFVPADLSHGKVLTEGDVSAIARSAGLNVRSANPDAAFDSAKSERFFSSFGRELRVENSGTKGEPQDGKFGWNSYWWSQNGGSSEDEAGAENEVEGPQGEGKGKGKGKNDMTPSDPD